VTPNSGKKRTPVSFNGSLFTPGDAVTVTYYSGSKRKRRATTVLCTATVDLTGSFTCSGVIPKRHRGGHKGTKTIVATDASGTSASTTFKLK